MEYIFNVGGSQTSSHLSLEYYGTWESHFFGVNIREGYCSWRHISSEEHFSLRLWVSNRSSTTHMISHFCPWKTMLRESPRNLFSNSIWGVWKTEIENEMHRSSHHFPIQIYEIYNSPPIKIIEWRFHSEPKLWYGGSHSQNKTRHYFKLVLHATCCYHYVVSDVNTVHRHEA